MTNHGTTRRARLALALGLSVCSVAGLSLAGPTAHADSPPGYVVLQGDSLSRIASRLGVRLADLLAANGLTVGSVILPGQRLSVPAGGAVPSSGGAASGATYTVVAGDSLSRIASRLGVRLADLLAANQLTVSSLILPGQRLSVPPGGSLPSSSGGVASGAASGATYAVVAGDSLSRVASRLGVRLADLLAANQLTVSSLILPGQRLNVPAGGSLPASTAAPEQAPSSSPVDAVLAFARAQLGKPYAFDTAGPDTFDCSGLTLAAYAEAGIALPHQSALQAARGTAVPFPDEPIRPGDLVFLATGGSRVINHVGIAIDARTWIHAVRPGDVVRTGAMPATSSIVAVRRLITG